MPPQSTGNPDSVDSDGDLPEIAAEVASLMSDSNGTGKEFPIIEDSMVPGCLETSGAMLAMVGQDPITHKGHLPKVEVELMAVLAHLTHKSAHWLLRYHQEHDTLDSVLKLLSEANGHILEVHNRDYHNNDKGRQFLGYLAATRLLIRSVKCLAQAKQKIDGAVNRMSSPQAK